MVKKNKLLDDYLDDLDLDDNLKKILSVISNTCYKISEAIRSSNINNLVGKTGEINVQGEQVEKLDEFSNNLLIKNLSESGKVFLMGSEEIESVIVPNPNNKDADKSFKVIKAALKSLGILLIIKSKSINTPCYT